MDDYKKTIFSDEDVDAFFNAHRSEQTDAPPFSIAEQRRLSIEARMRHENTKKRERLEARQEVENGMMLSQDEINALLNGLDGEKT